MSPNAWSVKFPVYQIDFTCVAAGKNIAATKRKIRWRFGFPNKKALDDGLHGTDCRGEEHEINVVWSLTSGKRQVTMDSKEVHYSSSRQGILDFSFTTRGNHVIKLVCHAAPPLSATPGFRQYDLFVDGQSFFTMPKMYELGVRGDAKYNRVPGYTGANNYSNPTSPITLGSGSQQSRSYDYAQPASREQEEADLRRAIQASIQESRAHLQGRSGDDNRSSYTAPLGGLSSGGGGGSDLLDLGGGGGGAITNPTPSPHDARSVGSYYSAPTTYNQHPPSGGYTPSSAATYQSPPPQQAGALVPAQAPVGGYYNAAPPHVSNSFATPPPVPPAPAPTPSFASPPPAEPMYSPAAVPPAPVPVAPSASAPAAPLYVQPPAPGGGYQGQNYMNTPSPQSNDVFGLNSPPGEDPFAPKAPPPPTYQDFTSSIMGAYTSASPTGSAPAVTPGSAASGGPPGANGFASPQANGEANAPVANGGGGLSMNALAITEEEKPKNSFDSVLKKLVNVDHIDEPAEGEFKLTMMKKEEEEKKKTKKGHSVPLPPVTTGRVGNTATLSDIQKVRSSGGTLKHDTEGKIMRPPPPNAFQPGAVHAGALVVHGQGPPPLQQPMGFGVGAQLPNGGLRNQQQPTYYMPQQQQAQYR